MLGFKPLALERTVICEIQQIICVLCGDRYRAGIIHKNVSHPVGIGKLTGIFAVIRERQCGALASVFRRVGKPTYGIAVLRGLGIFSCGYGYLIIIAYDIRNVI